MCGTDSIREGLEGPGGLLREGLVEWGGPLRRAHLGVSLGRPLVVASGSKAYRRAGSPGPSLLPLSAPLSLSFLPPPMLMTSSWASFTSAKDELRLTPLRKPSHQGRAVRTTPSRNGLSLRLLLSLHILSAPCCLACVVMMTETGDCLLRASCLPAPYRRLLASDAPPPSSALTGAVFQHLTYAFIFNITLLSLPLTTH